MSGAFEAITVVGGVLPPALLGRIQTGTLQDESGLKPASYFLSGRETIGDASSRSWAYLRGAWQDWQDADAKKGTLGAGTGDARQRWLLILLRELGYGQVPAAGSDLRDRDRFPVSHLWQSVPIHLLGPRVDLDKRNPGVEGAAKAPQKMLQEFLNHDAEYLWGILSNGLKLRLLRDSTALAGSAYVEFDLETIFTSDLYPEFQLFWQLCHQSRLAVRGEAESSPPSCWLEAWRSEAVEAGSRALLEMGGSVKKSLERLGTGLLRHPANAWLVKALHSGELSRHDFHKALLRTAYRLLFCFVVEERGALHSPGSTPEVRRRYDDYFSTRRLRALSRKHDGGPHPDLWRTQKLVLSALGGEGLEALGLPALGGLFDPDPRAVAVAGQPGLDLVLGCELSNKDLLFTVRSLSWVKNTAGRVESVDYRHLGAEELGSVYESLLELAPRIELETKSFGLENVAGNERKVTGSYYTPPNLVSALLDTALNPLLDEAVHQASDASDAERRLLALTVCDPASGSGGFLVAAARRIARRLAEVRAGEDEPRPEAIRHALHDVVDHCIYGVDMNDLAAELAKVSLWLEAMEPGKPLSFLDSRIKIGNSLIGATPALMAAGIPDDAFKPLEGDDKAYATAVRKQNKVEAKSRAGQFIHHLGQEALNLGGDAPTFDRLIADRERLNQPVASAAEARQRALDFASFDGSEELARRRLAADAWCASFVWPLDGNHAQPTTNAVYRNISAGFSNGTLADTIEETRQLQREYRFFHWHIEFPEVFGDPESIGKKGPHGWPGGFSCLLGNPPWERVKIQEQEFFASRDPEIAQAPNAAARGRLIKKLADPYDGDSVLFAEFLAAKRNTEGQSHFLRLSGKFLLTGRGDVNTYAVFAELFRDLTGPSGQSGVIVPTGIATDSTTQYFFKDLAEEKSIAALFDFENRSKLFQDVDSRFKFCLLTITGRHRPIPAARYAFFLHDPALIDASAFALTPEEITLINPNTGTLPIFRTRRDAEISLAIYKRVPVLINEHDLVHGNPWSISFSTMLHSSGDSASFHTQEELESAGWKLEGNIFRRSTDLGSVDEMLPLYEAKMLGQFDHRKADVVKSATAIQRQNQPRYLTDSDKANPGRSPIPLYWVEPSLTKSSSDTWLAGFTNITSSTNERTSISAALPISGVNDTYPLFFAESKHLLIAVMNSLVFDYIARQKVAGIHLTYSVLRQIATLTPTAISLQPVWSDKKFETWLHERILELCYTSRDMKAFAVALDDLGDPFIWEASRRRLIRAELDAALFLEYGIDRPTAEYILGTFPIIRRHDESTHGEYLTKRLVLEAYDAMQRAIERGVPYQSSITPPPGHGPRHPAKEAAS